MKNQISLERWLCIVFVNTALQNGGAQKPLFSAFFKKEKIEFFRFFFLNSLLKDGERKILAHYHVFCEQYRDQFKLLRSTLQTNSASQMLEIYTFPKLACGKVPFYVRS